MVAQNGPKMAQNGPNGPKMPINGNLKVAVVKNRENSVERRWNKLGEVQANVFGPIWSSRLPPNMAQGCPNWPKMPKNAQKLQCQVPVVRNGWNSMERRWSKLGEVHAEVFGPIWCSRVPPNLTQGRPKWPKLAQNAQKWQFLGFGDPKRLEQRGTKVEWVQKLRLGFPSTHSTLVLGCSNRFGPPKP